MKYITKKKTIIIFICILSCLFGCKNSVTTSLQEESTEVVSIEVSEMTEVIEDEEDYHFTIGSEASVEKELLSEEEFLIQNNKDTSRAILTAEVDNGAYIYTSELLGITITTDCEISSPIYVIEMEAIDAIKMSATVNFSAYVERKDKKGKITGQWIEDDLRIRKMSKAEFERYTKPEEGTYPPLGVRVLYEMSDGDYIVLEQTVGIPTCGDDIQMQMDNLYLNYSMQEEFDAHYQIKEIE